MEDVDNFTDDELRSRLQQFGFPVMPITGTTRKTMVKKLKLLIETKPKAGKEARRSLGRFSSEDESDTDSKAVKKAAKLKRATLAPASLMQPPAAAPRKPPKPEEEAAAASPGLQKEVKTTTTTTRTTRILKNARDEFDTGSESDEVAEKYEATRLPSSFLAAGSVAESASDRISQMRSRLSQYNLPKAYEGARSGPVDDVLKNEEQTPFLSNFTRRLSQLSDGNGSPKGIDYKNDVIKESDVNNGSGGSSRGYLNSYRSSVTRRPTSSYTEFKASGHYQTPNSSHLQQTRANIIKNNFVSFTVLIVSFLFFIVIAVVYLGIRSDPTPELTVMPICSKSDANSIVRVNCVHEDDGKAALNLLKVLKPELEKRTLINKCQDGNFKPYMTETQIVKHIQTNYAIKSESKIQNDLNNLELLAFLNRKWAIRMLILHQDGDDTSTAEIPTQMDDIIVNRKRHVIALMAANVSVPWKCSIFNYLATFLNVISSIIIGIVILYVLNYAYKYYQRHEQKRKDELNQMVENIIEILENHANEAPPSDDNTFLVINHVRDMLIPISERKTKEKLWKMALTYIDANESRIRSEVQLFRGEPSEVWRWLGGRLSSTLAKNKSWQGQAFEMESGSVNSLQVSPSSCLKIRGMVDEGDRNMSAIKKAVLAKCPPNCRILHCEVDSNCVYLKCVDANDAALAYRNLHGWWYAGNLVTVKYLRLERYMQRFPGSPASGPPFLQ